jgi:hypothetical protein
MILEILRGARWLDRKLEEAVGRPYRVIISAALIAEIVAQVRGLAHASMTRANFVQTLIWIAIGVLVVINQLGELSKRMEHRRAGGDAAEASPAGVGRAPERGRGRRRS